MISAQEAKQLFTQPPYTEDEVEQAIREAAIEKDFTGFDKSRLSEELIALLRTRGYQISEGGLMWIVRW